MSSQLSVAEIEASIAWPSRGTTRRRWIGFLPTTRLDTEYQAFVLVTGLGKTYSKQDLLDEARSGRVVYELQRDTEQTVRIWGDTAVITALLRAKGTDGGEPFDYKLWFSDTYVRTSDGWKYVFGQASTRQAP